MDRPSCCRFATSLKVLDGIVGLTFSVYAIVISIHWMTGLLLLLGLTRMGRCVILLLQTDDYTTIIMIAGMSSGIVYLLLSLVSLLIPPGPYLIQHASQLDLSTTLVHFLQQFPNAPCIILFLAAMMELVLFLWFFWTMNTTTTTTTLQDPLLLHSSSEDPHPWTTTDANNNRTYEESINPSSSRRLKFFSKWWVTPSNNGSNIRDDGSVDFSSVQEDWASKSEQDPFWWTKTGEPTTTTTTAADTEGDGATSEW
jgi:hypothetical protein